MKLKKAFPGYLLSLFNENRKLLNLLKSTVNAKNIFALALILLWLAVHLFTLRKLAHTMPAPQNLQVHPELPNPKTSGGKLLSLHLKK